MEFLHILNLQKPCKVYFLGIGGIGMSGIARFLYTLGFDIAGYDKTETWITQQLQNESIHITYNDPSTYIDDYDVIVYTPAIPKDQPAFLKAIELKKKLLKRSVILGIISEQFKTIAIAGTHGKTTTSSMVTHLLKTAEIDCTAFIGGITKNYQNNYISGKSNILVVEADEFDRSFLTLRPFLSIITSADPDHLDIYHSEEGFRKGFEDFIALSSERVYLENKIAYLSPYAQTKVETYGLNSGEYQVTDTHSLGLTHVFSVKHKNKLLYKDLQLNIPGAHNVSNMLAAIIIGREMGATEEQIRKGVATYQGVVRRFDIRFNIENSVYIDDYAHHPKEISATLTSIKELLPRHTLVVAFQPHLFSRTRDFIDGFADSLDQADVVILLPIYPAREQPIDGVNSEEIAKRMKKAKILFADLNTLPSVFENFQSEPFVWVTLGAGNIDTCVATIQEKLEHKYIN